MCADPEEHRRGLAARHLIEGKTGPQLEAEAVEQPATKRHQLRTEAWQREVGYLDDRQVGITVGKWSGGDK